ncbi:XdhC family protein [Metabacillus halosaccharovorans]|uniref:XdhC family protein n=1 Tax=Metabacillus halosaccharovorans TaxID=930124 RepID=UPI001C1FDE30|nr:XdhC family protein [Metabacillus halosaccharovorans]MBU7593089.1 XdhC family protein [Metabacillus halosaccharovorans]
MRTDVYEILESISQTKVKKVLATVVNVEGSAYKKGGSMMLIDENGEQTGLLSGGCLEEDLHARSKDLIEAQASTIVTYDLSAEDDLSWGQGIGCNGKITVLIETISSQLSTHLDKVKDYIDNGKTVTCVKRMTPEGFVTDYLFFTAASEYFGQWNGDIPNINELTLNKLSISERGLFFKQTIPARPRLFIYGAGTDARPLANLASLSGYQVIVADWRAGLCHKDNFPFSKNYVVTPGEFVRTFSFSDVDSIVVMTHHFQKDVELISLLIKTRIRYLGILGSKDRARRLFNGINPPGWVHFPVGLDIGAEGPHEIAISIMAQLIQLTKKRRDASVLV